MVESLLEHTKHIDGWKMATRNLTLLFCLLMIVICTGAGQQAIELSLAKRYLREFELACRRDNGDLWGIPLDGPLLFVDLKSRFVIANQVDAKGNLKQQGDIFAGTMPADIMLGNTAMEWSGVKWTLIIWQFLPQTPKARTRLLTHEAFHRIQDKIGLAPPESPANSHLNDLEGRLWLQLEWRALTKALKAQEKEETLAAIEDALVFRAHRRSLFPESSKGERSLELHEGLAEYTGVRLSETSAVEFADDIRKAPVKHKTFSRSFAYISGPAYGLLLDEYASGWRRTLKITDDLGLLLANAVGTALPSSPAEQAGRRSAKYKGASLRTAEVKRQRQLKQQIAGYLAKLVDGPVLILPIPFGSSGSFNPREIIQLSDHEMIQPSGTIKAEWGILTISGGGAFLDDRNKVVHVTMPPAPKERPLVGDGWKVQLNDGWTVRPAKRRGDYMVVENDQPRQSSR
jgi:hypothetical protein